MSGLGLDLGIRMYPQNAYNLITSLGSSLLGYWDAQYSSSFTLSGSNVTTWADLIGGYAPTQAVSGSKPVYSATSFNGGPGVTFDGTDDYLELTPAPASFPTGATAGEVWVLGDQTALPADATSRYAAGYGTSGAGRSAGRNVSGGVNRTFALIGPGAGNFNVTGATGDFSGRHVLRVQIGAASTLVSLDGGATSSVAGVPATTANLLRLGAAGLGSVSNYWSGPISAILYTTALSAAQATQLLAYLKARGGIA